MTPLTGERAADLDRWFFRRGLTSLLDDTSIRVEASRRATTFLVTEFVLVMLLGVPAVTGNVVISALIAIVAVIAVWAGANLARKRKPFAAVARFGWPEGIAFVAVPALAALVSPHTGISLPDITITSLQARFLSALGLLVLQAVVLAVSLAAVKFGVISLAGWLVRELFGTVASTGASLTRTLPLLMGVVAFFFFTGELWQSVGELGSWAYLGVIALFVALSLAFLSSQGAVEIAELTTFSSDDELRAALARTPLRVDEGQPTPVTTPVTTRLSPNQQRNLRLISTVSRLLVASLVGSAVFVFFMALGVLAVGPDVINLWTESPAEVIVAWTTVNHHYALTHELLRVAGFLAVFSGFYYSVVSATDPALREGMRDTAAETIREACAARIAVLARDRANPVASGPNGTALGKYRRKSATATG